MTDASQRHLVPPLYRTAPCIINRLFERWWVSQVIVNLHSAHMDADDWQQPQQFRPERFLDESGNVVDRDRVIPFSLGTSILTVHNFIIKMMQLAIDEAFVRLRWVCLGCPSLTTCPYVPTMVNSSWQVLPSSAGREKN